MTADGELTGTANGRLRPRILVVAPSAELYGSDRTLLQAMPALVQQFDVTVAVPAEGPGLASLESMATEVVSLPDYALRRRHLTPVGFLPWLWRCLVSVVRLQRHHRRQPFTLVYSNTLAASLGPVLKLLWRRAHVVHVHECPVSPAWLPRILLAIVRASADVVVCNSRFTRDYLISHQPALAARSVVVHNGVEPVEAPPVPVPGPWFRITCVGRIHPKKGQAVLIDAARMARDAGHPWSLHFYGDALPEHRELEAGLRRLVADHGLEDRVHWHGFETDPFKRYGGADVAVVPSVQAEEFSLVCAEAQVMLLPVVATGPGGPSEILVEAETGFVVPPNDSEALFKALRTLECEPALRVRMGRKGRERVLAQFSEDAYSRRLTEVLLRAAGLRPATPLDQQS